MKRWIEFNRRSFTPQIEGSKTGSELPGIVDQVITMAEFVNEQKRPFRAFICQTMNPYGYPAKDTSGRLKEMEEPHLGNLRNKIRSTPRKDENLNFNISSAAG